MASLLRYILILTLLSIFPTAMSADDFIVVVDAGHGGHDYGAIGKKTNEKSINLGVALKLGKLLKEMRGWNRVSTQTTPIRYRKKTATANQLREPRPTPSVCTEATKTSKWPNAKTP